MSSTGGKDDNHANGKRRFITPDYGSAYVPNAGPAHLAPKSLDHFKRGYQERAAQRDKEYYSRRHGPTGREGKAHEFRNDRPAFVNGLDINRLADRLSSKLHDKKVLFAEIDETYEANREGFETGRAMTALISVAARRKNIGLGWAAWDYMDHANLQRNTFHYNAMISITEKARNYHQALDLMKEMKAKKIPKNEVTYVNPKNGSYFTHPRNRFSSAISACEKCGEWKTAIDILNSMDAEGVKRTAIAYNATISACEKGMVPQKACEVFQRMKGEGITPSVVSYSALISAAEKGGQWKLALDILEEMKQQGFTGNVVAYSAAISALAKGQQWRRALELFREIQSHGGSPSIVTYNATMTALEKGMQWERAMDLFEEMKMRNLPITVVSYGSAISACDKGFQYRQCLEFLDEMTDMGIQKNVIIFGAAMSCMEKCSRADIGFELLKRMREEGIQPNVHIYNSLISACARSNYWEKGYALYEEMEQFSVKRDVVTYNAVSSQIRLGRTLFKVGVEKGFYAKVSRLGEHWFELDLHFLSLGGGEIALGWWFEDCLVPYLQDTSKLEAVKSISIVTGYGKTRTRGRRHGDDGMRKRCKAMLKFMNIKENEQSNAGRIHVDKASLIEEVNRNGGKVTFDIDAYISWKDVETTANVIPDVEQKIRARFKPRTPGSGRPPFVRVENESTSEEYLLRNMGNRSHRDQEFAGPEYRSDIDYALRDGIRFKPGAQSGPDEHRNGDHQQGGDFRSGRRRGSSDVGYYGDSQPRGGGFQNRVQDFKEPNSWRGPQNHGREENRRRDEFGSSQGRSAQERHPTQRESQHHDESGYYGKADHSDRNNVVDRHEQPERNRDRGNYESDRFNHRERDDRAYGNSNHPTGRDDRAYRYNSGGNGNVGHQVQTQGHGDYRRQGDNTGHGNYEREGDYYQERNRNIDRGGDPTSTRKDSSGRGGWGNGFSDRDGYRREESGERSRSDGSHRGETNGYDRKYSPSPREGQGYNSRGDGNRSHQSDRNYQDVVNGRERFRGNERNSRGHDGFEPPNGKIKKSNSFEGPGASKHRSVESASMERRPSVRGYALEPPTKRNRLS